MTARIVSAAFIAWLAALAPAGAKAGFAGPWTQEDAKHPCSVVMGFDLNRDGTAKVDWVVFQRGDPQPFILEARHGKWTAPHGTLDLKIIDPGVNGTRDTELDVKGKKAPGDRLRTVMTDDRDRAIDGEPYAVNCVYIRTQP